MTTIAVDCMGGDHGTSVTLPACRRFLEQHPQARLVLVGLPDALEGFSDPRVTIVAASEVVGMGDSIEVALRRKKDSSMRVAVQQVRDGQAQAAVSAGNTGALMAMAKIALRTMPGIDRPALAALLPSLGDNDVVMLDLGANTDCDANNLVQFAVMGAAYARTAMGLEKPRVALLNIGTEELKGTDEIRDAAALLREAQGLPMQFVGFIEGDKLSRGDVDVIVHDGFSGNIALKTIEGTARFVTDLLRRAFTSSVRSKIGFLISRPATELLRHHLDPNNHNGAVFLGLNGVVLKSHGSADAKGVANCVHLCAELIEKDITRQVTEDLANFRGSAAA